jgi:hypothetical protein
MPRVIKNFKIELNSADNLRDLLQCVMELADEQIKQAQDEINKFQSSMNLKDEAMDGKSKYAKAINDFLVTKNKATAQKIEVAKMLQEVIKYNGDLKAGMEDKNSGLDINSLQAMVDQAMKNGEKQEEAKVVTLKKPK